MKTLNSDKMVSFGGAFYYIDLDELDKQTVIKIANKEVSTVTETTHIDPETDKIVSIARTKSTGEREDDFNSTRHEMIRTMVDFILDYDDDMEDSLGSDRALDKATLPFKICFNTLIANEILKEI